MRLIMSHSTNLSKSQYTKGSICPKALWLDLNKKELASPLGEDALARIESGNEVGLLAQQYFGDALVITEKAKELSGQRHNTELCEKITKECIQQGHELIFEATAINPHDGTHCRIDILKKDTNADTWQLIEVKASTKQKDYHLDDIAFQYHVFTGAGYKISTCFLMLLDNTYIRQGELDLQKLFKLEDVTSKICQKQLEIPSKIRELEHILLIQEEPKHDIGGQCKKPFDCPYHTYCYTDVPAFSILNIFKAPKNFRIAKEVNSYAIKDIPLGEKLSEIKQIDKDAFLYGKRHIDKEAIQEWLSQLKMPLYFLDYETINPPVPLFDNSRPYQQIPFQFSLHVQRELGGELEHIEFLHTEQSDPRKNLVETLIKSCGTEGSIIVYYETFEKTRNTELRDIFSEYKDLLDIINERVVDLLVPFRKRYLYDPAQNGSASIKKVLPAFVPYLDYKGMEISNGSEAMNKYYDFITGKMSADDSQKLFTNLSEYCSLDTMAMVKLLNVLKKIVAE